MRLARLALAPIALAGAAEVAAQPAGLTTYPADYFAQYSPSNALQIVQRVPGFTLEKGDQDVRGFSQAAGNVVINGQRPSTKSDTIETILQRIPANRVLRVEIGAGDLFGSEYSGKPQVVNLVLTEAGGLSATAEAQVRRSYTGRLLPNGSLSALLKRGKSTLNGAISFNNDFSTEEGTDRLLSLPARDLIEFRRKVNNIREYRPTVSGSWAYDDGPNKTAHLNGRASLNDFLLKQSNDVSPTGGLQRDDRLSQDYDTRVFEIGGDVTRPLAGGGIKLIGLATRRHRNQKDLSFNRRLSVVTGGFAQTLDDQRNETVARLVWNRANLRGWSVETGVEGVLNTLDSKVDLFSIAAGDVRTPIDLPVDEAFVKEYRGEAFVNAGRPLSPELRLDLGLTYEASRLTVSGDATAKRSLRFLKPKATLDWRPGNGWHATFSVNRKVAQLQFEDFISSAELTTDRVNAGNPNLLPQRTWEFRASVEKPVLKDGLAKLELGYDRISLLQDRVPTPEGFDAPGNLGSARAFILRATLDLPLSSWGIKGGRLTSYLSLYDTNVRDPYTFQGRDFSGANFASANTRFRQDLGKYAWGFGVYYDSSRTFFRLNELDTNFNTGLYGEAFAEYRPSARTTVTIGVENGFDTGGGRRRSFFLPNRATLNPAFIEIRERNRHVLPYISIKQNFG